MSIEEDTSSNGSTRIAPFRRSTTSERYPCLSSAQDTLTRECACRFIEEPCILSPTEINSVAKDADQNDSRRTQNMQGVRKDGDQELLRARRGE